MSLAALNIRNPVMGFRLDPGEPGMLRRARATEATLQVTGQENRNLVRLKSEAIREGRVIIHAGIQYGRGFVGPFLTVTNGLTTVISREPRPNLFESETARQAAEGGGPPALLPPPPPDETDEVAVPSARPEVAGGGESDEDLASEETALRAELRRLEQPGFGVPLAAEEAGPLRALDEAGARSADALRDDQTREVEGELRRVAFRRLMAGMNALAATA